MKEFIQRFCNEKAKLDKFEFKKMDKETVLILKSAILLEPYKWQSIITRVDYESSNLFSEVLQEIGNLTESKEK